MLQVPSVRFVGHPSVTSNPAFWRNVIDLPDRPGIYLIHIEPAYKHAGHYLGFARHSLKVRVGKQLAGQGAQFTKFCLEHGHVLILARIWIDEPQTVERKLKNWHGSARLCPICKERKK